MAKTRRALISSRREGDSPYQAASATLNMNAVVASGCCGGEHVLVTALTDNGLCFPECADDAGGAQLLPPDEGSMRRDAHAGFAQLLSDRHAGQTFRGSAA